MMLRGLSPEAQLIGFVVCLIGLLAWLPRIQASSPPPNVEPAWTFVDVQYLESFDSIKSRVNTSEGVFLVDRPVMGWKGKPLVVLTKGDGSSWLCDQAQTACHRIFR
jgi:hypothetical protein